MTRIAVVDYGLGNIRSITSAVRWLGVEPILAAQESDFECASGVILPGVGAFPHGMSRLRQLGLDVALKSAASRDVPILGICLGMQLLFSSSDEFGETEGLDLVPGNVRKLTTNDEIDKVPNVNWRPLLYAGGNGGSSLLAGLCEEDEVYFVHSYAPRPESEHHVLSETIFSGSSFCSTVQHGLIFGCQYHPEKSGPVGLKILKNFISICEGCAQ